MLNRLPERYTVLIAGTGKAPITLTLRPVPFLAAALVMAAIPIGIIGRLAQHNSRLAHQNQELTDAANAVLNQINTLDGEIETLKERAGLETKGNQTRLRAQPDAPEHSIRINLDREIERRRIFGPSPDERLRSQRGGPALPVNAITLFRAAQQRMPSLALALEADVKPALEETLAQEADRAAAFPDGMPLKGKVETTSEFGPRRNPFGGSNYEMHEGLDFRGPIGRPVYAAADGRIVRALDSGGYGKHIIIDHSYGYETLYAHLSDFNVQVGDRVQRGELIGLLGNTGRSSGPHLHYGVYRDGKAVNPRYYLKSEDSQL